MLIWFMNKIYLYLLPFSCRIRLGFSLPLIKITAWIDRPQTQKKLTKAEDRDPPITAHTLTSVWPSCFLRGQVRCTDYWKQNGVHVTVCFGLNFRTRPHSTLRKKEETKFWGRLVESVVFQKTVIGSTFDYGIEAKYEYWIVDLDLVYCG